MSKKSSRCGKCNHAELCLVQHELTKKSELLTMVLNVIIPGFGYIYCGRYFLGIFCFILFILALVATLGIGCLVLIPIYIIDGVLVAKQYNKDLLSKLYDEYSRMS